MSVRLIVKKTPKALGRGRPRDSRIDSEVGAAVLKVLLMSGYRAVTIERIARDVQRARTSIYRRWPSKRHLVAHAVMSELGEDPAPDTGNLGRDLEGAIDTLLRAFAGPLGQALAGLFAEMSHDSALAETIRKNVLASRRHSIRAAFARARGRGEIRDNLDIELILDMLTAPFYFRTLFKHASITRRTKRNVVDYVLRVVAKPTDRQPSRRRR